MGLAAWVAIFGLAAALVMWSGIQLAKAGDQIAERANLSRLAVGVLLMATATSLPEIVTGVSASLAGAPDLAVGDLLGSCMANMATLGVIDLLHRHRVWPSVEVGHARVASVAIVLVAMAVMGIVRPVGFAVGWVGVDTIAIAGFYVAANLWMHRSPTGRFSPELVPVPTGWATGTRTGLRPAVLRFALAAVVVLVAAPVLARSGQEIAVLTGLGETFVGTVFLALATTMPELVSSLAAVRIGAHDLAVGNLFGSNAFNMFALLFADSAYRDGPLLAAVDGSQAIVGVGAIFLMALALTALVHGLETRVHRLEPDAVLLLACYGAILVAVGTA